MREVSRVYRFILYAQMVLMGELAFAQNPLIMDQFTADPTARVFGGKVYVYPSHDILAEEGKGRTGWFCMEDYHVFSSADLIKWTDHGVIVSQEQVPWADPNAYSMWAPDCIEKNGKYYFYFPTRARDTTYNGKGFTIGVAIADNPAGPFNIQSTPIIGVRGIDPNVLIDKDGQAYLYWSQGSIYGARLKENMLELAEEPHILGELPQKGLKEGPFVFERNGIYYLTYPHVENKTERLEYAISDNPLGPFTVKGVIMDEWANGCWTNHHSILKFEGQWYLFYHHNDLSPDFDKARSICADSLFFDTDGSILKVTPTFRGIGSQKATEAIHPDRYSLKSDGVNIAFNDTLDTFKGWHAVLGMEEQWIQYNSVNLRQGLRQVIWKVRSPLGGKIEVRLDGTSGSIISTLVIPEGSSWQELKSPIYGYESGIHNIAIISKGNSVDLDWLRFEEQ